MDELTREQQKATLIAEITTAFNGVSREDGITLHEAQALDDYAGPEERAIARALDTESRWQDVPTEDITQGYNVLCFLDPKGFRYYIPAFLIWYLTSEEDSNTYNSIVSRLGGGYEEGEYDLFRVSLLTPGQLKAITHFLVFNAEEERQWHKEVCELGRVRYQEAGWTEEEIRAQFETHAMRNDSQSALDRYWGRFL